MDIILEEVIRRKIVSAIEDGFEQYREDYKYSGKTFTTNHHTFVKHDLINDNLYREFNSGDYTCKKFKSGSWELIIIYNSISMITLTTMTFKTFNIRKKKKQYPNYLKALIMNLNKTIPLVQGQLDLGIKENDEQKIVDFYNKVKSELNIDENNTKHYLVCYNQLDDIVNSVAVYLLDTNFDTHNKLDLSNYLTPNLAIVDEKSQGTHVESSKNLISIKRKNKSIVSGDSDDINEKVIN